MHTVPAYERDVYLQELETEVAETGVEDGRPFAVLTDTILYPEGGGQPADRGSLGEIAILDVQRREGGIRHYLERPAQPGPVTVRLDWRRRFDHMQQHTGQHLLTALAHDRFGWPTTAFHLGEQVCDIELDVPALAPIQIEMLEESAAEEIRAARPVTSRHARPDDLERLGVRTRGLPAGHHGDVRLVEIAGIDLNTCGGTHVRSTAEIEAVKLLGTEFLRGGTRLFYIAGGRVRHRLASHEARSARLRSLLGTPDAEIVAAVEARLEAGRATEKRIRALEEELAAAVAEALATRPDRVVSVHLEGKDTAFLQRIAKRLTVTEKAALLTASGTEGGFFVLVAGETVNLDVQAAGRELAGIMGGRGGGSGRTFQGKVASLADREAALHRLTSLVGGK
ncbi:MAG TPA: alanyl-tRNA editing protein [Thermoanaerobaculaceae bacterium]|nr:alanyl-tRNA editing protein [Thermoanaerobaculaceae bacterium]